ncbi:hypothetical protein [Hephaestia mangrovi]|uniref:hypothetical protein n=1 Tax=Hephaestia mangrovi TaxID=2873268 RepID=UPI001CA6F53E|nr:hypothetical protein [Hephaestia mangrovi]MBY8827616.1 hypothetical protein [Hephaestia mangrovi]
MRLMSKVLLGGFATVALAGTAVAAEHAVHVMNVAMPDGTIAKVRYVGDTPPQVHFVPVAVRAVPVAMVDPGFAAMDRMMAAMDARADAMMQQAAMMARLPATAVPLQHADMKTVPGGTVSYSYVSTTSSNGCTQTVRMTSNGSSDQPQVIRTSAGTCDNAKVTPAVADGVAPARTVKAVETKPIANKPVDPNTI